MPGTAVGKHDYTGQLRRSPIPDSATFHWNSANAGRASALALQLPMPYATLDLILRTAIFTLAMAAAAAVLVRSKRSGVPAGLSAIAIGGIGAFAVSSAPAALNQYGPVVFLFDAWCIATPAVIWILAQSLFRENFRPGPAHWLLAGIITIVTFAADWGRFGLGILGEAPRVAEKILFAGRGAALVFVLAAGYAASRTGALTWSNPGAVRVVCSSPSSSWSSRRWRFPISCSVPRAPAPRGSCPVIWYLSQSPSPCCS